ncbi:molybdate transport system substrate-binding protein [Methanococcus maripaludis]|uniref:Molybdate transport system substrate-binding protein n=1 Tax=Methanococcus maripaludis TaxID=39152 RepID=A0A7J9P055_METMI|nr:substrate-binding domain-containing protein [Methanococcus maripaludis]MBA2852855.1 molybdate transport system substrate-binding protein [Methanococcus maripaludis]
MNSKYAILLVGLVALTVMFSGCTSSSSAAEPAEKEILTVYSCGGPTEALADVNAEFEKEYNCEIRFTGAAAGKLRKALEDGAYADVFLPRSVTHSEVLANAGLMNPDYKVYQFTDWVIITPTGNPKNISTIEDLLNEDVNVYTNSKSSIPALKAMAPEAESINAIYEKSAKDYDCYRKMLSDVASGNADAALVERRCTTLTGIAGNIEVIDLPRETMTPQIGIFTVGVMNYAEHAELAYKYQEFVLTDKAQAILADHGFIPVNSEQGQELYNNYYPEYLSLNN